MLRSICFLQEELVRAGILPTDYDFEAHKEFVPMQPGYVNKTAANISKAKKFLKYKPKVSFETGIRNFVEWKKKIDSINLELRQ